jgi:FHS family L-fucose permease-like MFS transporter
MQQETPKTDRQGLFGAPGGGSYLRVFLLVSCLFLLWGFASGLLDNLNKHFQNSLSLSKFQSGFVQNAFYMGYFAMALPAGWIARRLGYKGGIATGLALASLGAFWFIPASRIDTYWAFLLGLFVMASGLACLETVANPYTTVLGPPAGAARRINLAQMCNGLGWISGMFIGAHVILSATRDVNRGNSTLYIPYLIIGTAALVLLIAFALSRIPDLKAHEELDEAILPVRDGRSRLFARWHFSFGVAAQFLYVAAQTGIFSFFINYSVANIDGLSDQAAGNLQTAAFALFALGRLAGSAVIGWVRPSAALGLYAVINVALMIVALTIGGLVGVGAVMASFFFMSIMFPTIFALSIDGIGQQTKLGSSILVMSIVGGAIMTPVMGLIADRMGMRIGFAVPLACFAFVAAYSALWPRFKAADAGAASPAVAMSPLH